MRKFSVVIQTLNFLAYLVCLQKTVFEITSFSLRNKYAELMAYLKEETLMKPVQSRGS